MMEGKFNLFLNKFQLLCTCLYDLLSLLAW